MTHRVKMCRAHGYPKFACPVCWEGRIVERMAPLDTLSVDTVVSRHSDMNGDLVGDVVTSVIVDEQGFNPSVTDLGSRPTHTQTTSTSGNNEP